MSDNVAPTKTGADCDSAALARNEEFGRKHLIRDNPALLFEDGKRVSGAMPRDAFDNQLADSRRNGWKGESLLCMPEKPPPSEAARPTHRQRHSHRLNRLSNRH
jgi:hypothetical protein